MTIANTATEYRDLPLSVLTESKTNPRRFFEDSALNELAASIRSQGVLSPLLVRPLTERSFEIVAGARRYRAAQLAEAETVPVRIVNLTDAEALEAQLIENLQRRDVHPLEEAQGFRRLSERLIIECGEVPEMPVQNQFAALYVNANDFADAFARFPEHPTAADEARLVCYANLCVLGDLLTVQSARAGRLRDGATDALLELVQRWLVPDTFSALVVGEDRLERYRAILEQHKWFFPHAKTDATFPGYAELAQHRWLIASGEDASLRCKIVSANPTVPACFSFARASARSKTRF